MLISQNRGHDEKETRRSQKEFPVAMKILVCGGAGFIGAPLTAQLAQAGHEVRATMHTKEPVRVPGVKYCEVDLTARGEWARIMIDWRPDVVYMVAGKTGGSGLDPLHFVTDNALMALHLYRACAEFGVKRIVYLSSTTGYPDSLEPMREEDYFYGEPHPAYFNPGHTKRFIERLGAMWAHKVETVVVRVAGVYGPGSDFDLKSAHVIEATIRKIAERHDPLIVWGDGNAVRDAVYIADFVDALFRCKDWPAGAYNFATGHGMSVNNILHLLLAHSGHECRIERDLSKPEMIRARVLNWSRAEAFGWAPHTMMPAGIKRTYDWYRSQHG